MTVDKILGETKTVRELLKGVKYAIDYYQREYKWQEKQVGEMVDDLCDTFREGYDPSHARTKVAEYPRYFLGSIIISDKGGESHIVDGQQRLTSLTLLLIFLNNLQKKLPGQVNVDELIFCEKYGEKSFNIQVDERTPLMEALFKDQPVDVAGKPESVQNLHHRYEDLKDSFPEDLSKEALPYFIDWLLENVVLVKITADSDEDAYTIFETMNDRGLSLSPTEMLKGYLLANISGDKRTQANNGWRARIRQLNEAGKEVESDCLKAWFRSQYAQKIRERKKEAKPEDYDRIGTEFHRWLRDASEHIGLKKSDDFFRFIDRDFDFYSRRYLRIVEAGAGPVPGLEHVFYNAQNGFNLQNTLLLAPLVPGDSEEVADRKTALVARYVDILLTWRLWNFRSIAYSTMQYTMFLVMREIRGLDPPALAAKLHELLLKEEQTFANGERLFLHQMNRRFLHRILARLTDYVETQSGLASHYAEYVAEGANRYEIEHVWADHFKRHTGEFDSHEDFAMHRNLLGGLLLLPKKFNGSYGDLPYEKKLPHYLTQNLLARSLHPQCYNHNPGFVQFVKNSTLPFKPHQTFTRKDLEERCTLYRHLAERIWNPNDLLGTEPTP